tara:strand:+ start:730 stop:879 length:150 start_codon:yes stop_codon:yes gene_type:complete
MRDFHRLGLLLPVASGAHVETDDAARVVARRRVARARVDSLDRPSRDDE